MCRLCAVVGGQGRGIQWERDLVSGRAVCIESVALYSTVQLITQCTRISNNTAINHQICIIELTIELCPFPQSSLRLIRSTPELSVMNIYPVAKVETYLCAAPRKKYFPPLKFFCICINKGQVLFLVPPTAFCRPLKQRWCPKYLGTPLWCRPRTAGTVVTPLVHSSYSKYTVLQLRFTNDNSNQR